MSIEQAKAFSERMKTDEAFHEKVMAIDDAAGRIAFIQAEGFYCTAGEINEICVDIDSIAGGTIGDCSSPHQEGYSWVCGGQYNNNIQPFPL